MRIMSTGLVLQDVSGLMPDERCVKISPVSDNYYLEVCGKHVGISQSIRELSDVAHRVARELHAQGETAVVCSCVDAKGRSVFRITLRPIETPWFLRMRKIAHRYNGTFLGRAARAARLAARFGLSLNKVEAVALVCRVRGEKDYAFSIDYARTLLLKRKAIT